MNMAVMPAPDRDMAAGTRNLNIDQTAEERLGRSSDPALQGVSRFASGDVIHLDGCPPSHAPKQLAREINARVDVVRGLIDRIEVLGPGPAAAAAPG